MAPKNTKMSQDRAKKSLLRAILAPPWHHLGAILAANFDHIFKISFWKSCKKPCNLHTIGDGGKSASLLKNVPRSPPRATRKTFSKLFFQTQIRCLLEPILASKQNKLDSGWRPRAPRWIKNGARMTILNSTLCFQGLRDCTSEPTWRQRTPR